MNKPGSVFSILKEDQPIAGCTISRDLLPDAKGMAIVFSIGAGTDISPETYRQNKLIWVIDGDLTIHTDQKEDVCLTTSDACWTEKNVPTGTETEKGAIYIEFAPGDTESMNLNPVPGEVFKLADLVPYKNGSIVNRDVFSTPGMKLVVMSFDEGTGLSEHAAPGEALLFGLEGEATITYEGVDHVLHAGEEILFAKNGLHAVQANGPFKMALLMCLEPKPLFQK